jgi:hypothetical protein
LLSKNRDKGTKNFAHMQRKMKKKNGFYRQILAYVKKKQYLCTRKGFITMNDYRFINIDQEPSEEQLAQLMHEVAVEAKERHDRAHAAYFEQIHQMAQAL